MKIYFVLISISIISYALAVMPSVYGVLGNNQQANRRNQKALIFLSESQGNSNQYQANANQIGNKLQDVSSFIGDLFVDKNVGAYPYGSNYYPPAGQGNVFGMIPGFGRRNK